MSTRKKLTIKLIGDPEDIFAYLSKFGKMEYPQESIEISKIKREEGEDHSHLFITVHPGKVPPPPDFAVKEVQ